MAWGRRQKPMASGEAKRSTAASESRVERIDIWSENTELSPALASRTDFRSQKPGRRVASLASRRRLNSGWPALFF